MNGKVEKKKVNSLSIERNLHKERLSSMQWETLPVIANSINDLPLDVRSKTAVKCMDLITLNRLLFGSE